MTPTIEKLLRVQDCDIRLIRLNRELTDIPARKKDIDSRLSGHREAVAKAKETLKIRQAETRGLESEIETHKAQIRKLREQQMQLKSNKEFKAMEVEIEVVQGKIRGIEEKILEIMELVEQANSEIKTCETELHREEDSLQVDIHSLTRRSGDIEVEVKKLQDERAQFAKEVDPQWLAAYDRIFNNKKEAVLHSTANGSCGGCHMKLPPYIIHDARKQLQVVVCNYCGRMLYAE